MSVGWRTFLIVAAVLACSPAFATENLHCAATVSFYPASNSCPVPWVKMTTPGAASPQQAQQIAQLVQCKVADRDIRLLTAAQCPIEGARVKAEAEARANAAQAKQAASASAVLHTAAPVADNTISCSVSVETEKQVYEMHNERMTYEQCEAEHARENAALLAEDHEKKKEQAERARAFKNAAGKPFAIYKEELAQANEEADSRGFKRMTFEDFKLDGADMAREGGKASISGAFQKYGRVEYLLPNSGYVMQLMTSGNVSSGIVLVTDGAPRDVRKYFLECPDDLLPSSRGCPINILAHATTCELKTLVGTVNVPCLAVDDGWHVIENTEIQHEATTRPGP
ncbi:MAG: hypothetical protein WDN69_34445 [Aliidongia sp.]